MRFMHFQGLTKASIIFLLGCFPFLAEARHPPTYDEPMLLKGTFQNIELSSRSGKITAISSGREHKRYRVSSQLKLHLGRAEQYKVLLRFNPKNKERFLLLLREPSNPLHRTGYCGAGYEDYLLLVEVNNEISVLDRFLLQSCIETIDLDTDNSDDPLDLIRINADASITFRWLGDAEESQQTLSIQNDRFKVSQSPIQKQRVDNP